jgi:hypothetical protein
MDFWYDGQIRRYVTQFMRVFIGFKYKANDQLRSIPVTYGDMSRQVANIIRDNSENKLPTVPKIACYISGLEMDNTRLSDATFVSKANVRERRYVDTPNGREYQNVQGAGYTVERIMPTPFKLRMKADIWTSSTDQKLQLLEQLLVLFNPSLEIQTTDNYLDWTSLSTLDIRNINFSSRSIPAGAETEIDICTIEFEMPIWLTPPAKVKKLGIVQAIITNMFTESGNVVDLEKIIYNQENGSVRLTTNQYNILLFKSQTSNTYEVSIVDKNQAVQSLGLAEKSTAGGAAIDWNTILELRGGYVPGSLIYFEQPNGVNIVGTYVVNSIDPTILVVTFDNDTIPGNTVLTSSYDPAGKTYIDAIIDPYKFNPLSREGGRAAGVRYLMLDDVNPSPNRGSFATRQLDEDGDLDLYEGPRGWENVNGSDPFIKANSIVEWNGAEWVTIFDPDVTEENIYIQNLRTKIQYRWDSSIKQWVKSFEGEYGSGFWGFVDSGC